DINIKLHHFNREDVKNNLFGIYKDEATTSSQKCLGIIPYMDLQVLDDQETKIEILDLTKNQMYMVLEFLSL
ncbi:1220_t:CDS:1, partial [Scutellospora calospora]